MICHNSIPFCNLAVIRHLYSAAHICIASLQLNSGDLNASLTDIKVHQKQTLTVLR